MEELRLWGSSQVPDAKVIVENWLGDNKNIPQIGTQVEMLPEHFIEWKRCKDSIHYFAENYYTITVGGNDKQLMELWEIQKEALDYFTKHNRVVMNSSRQTSKTTLVILFVLWNLLFGDGLQKIGLLGNKFDLAKLNLNKVKEAYEYLPLFLKPHVDKWNEKCILFENKNECKITATSSTSFRGDTLTSLVIDEAAFVNEGGKNDLDKEILQSLLPTLDAMAFSPHGDNSFCILVSTPYGMNNMFAKLYHQAKEYSETGNPKIKTPFKHFQMLWSDHPARDEQWFHDKIAEMGSEEAFYVEFGGSFTMGDDQKRVIDNLVKIYQEENNIIDPIFKQDKLLEIDNPEDEDDVALRIWEFPKDGHIYVSGVDVAEGVGDCSSTMVTLDITDLSDIRQVAEYRCNTISVEQFPLVVMKIANAFNQCYVAIEQNNSGREVISSLYKSHGYKKLVKHHYNAESDKRMRDNDEYGVVSHNNSKNSAITHLRHYLNTEKSLKLRSKMLIKELDGFVRVSTTNNNHKWKKQGGSGSYDDIVDALSWAMYILHAKLVEDYYELSEDGYNECSKPIKLVNEVLQSAGDHRIHQFDMPINGRGVDIPIYTSESYIQYSDGFDIEWLQNF